jgi:hypothetical protein
MNKIIQLIAHDYTLYALDTEGSVYTLDDRGPSQRYAQYWKMVEIDNCEVNG